MIDDLAFYNRILSPKEIAADWYVKINSMLLFSSIISLSYLMYELIYSICQKKVHGSLTKNRKLNRMKMSFILYIPRCGSTFFCFVLFCFVLFYFILFYFRYLLIPNSISSFILFDNIIIYRIRFVTYL